MEIWEGQGEDFWAKLGIKRIKWKESWKGFEYKFDGSEIDPCLERSFKQFEEINLKFFLNFISFRIP